MHCHLNEPVPRPSAKVSEIPRALDDLVAQLMAKPPQDRPFDAVAVGQVLEQLREKTNKGEAVPMVWPTDGTGPNPKLLGGPPLSKKKPRPAPGEELAQGLRRYETLGLVLALIFVGAIIAYFAWPPSDEYLFAQAEKLWNTGERHNRVLALEKYIDPLDKRNPKNAYQVTTREWREAMELLAVENRAKSLESPVLHELTTPHNEIETRWRDCSLRVAAARNLHDKGKLHDDPYARELYRDLAKTYDEADSAQRPWHRLALKKAEAISQEIEDRRKQVDGLLEEMEGFRHHGRLDRLESRREQLEEMAHLYPDVKEHLESLGIRLSAPPQSSPPSTPTPGPVPSPSNSPEPAVPSPARNSTPTKPVR
jgi:serine/threonine-protein kinase